MLSLTRSTQNRLWYSCVNHPRRVTVCHCLTLVQAWKWQEVGCHALTQALTHHAWKCVLMCVLVHALMHALTQAGTSAEDHAFGGMLSHSINVSCWTALCLGLGISTERKHGNQSNSDQRAKVFSTCVKCSNLTFFGEPVML